MELCISVPLLATQISYIETAFSDAAKQFDIHSMKSNSKPTEGFANKDDFILKMPPPIYP
jgi:hypothetical protein